MEPVTAPAPPRVRIFDRTLLEERGYWTGVLAAGVERAGPPPDLPPAEEGTGEAAFALSDAAAAALERVSRGNDLLAHAALVAGMQVCLWRYAGGRDGTAIAVAAPPRLGDGDAPAPNLLPLIATLDGATSFREVLTAARQALLDAYARQGFPFERMLRDAGAEERRPALEAVSLALRGFSGALPEGSREMEIEVERRDGRIEGRARFALSRFRAATVERFLGHFATLLDALLADPSIAIGDARMMGEAEERRVLEDWNPPAARRTDSDSQGPAPAALRVRRLTPLPDAPIHALVAEWAVRTPDAIAVEGADGTEMTYAELDAASRRLAGVLRDRGVGPESRVGLCLEQGTGLVAAMLAVLRAGAAYVPLDPAYPADRLAWMLEDSGVEVVITRSGLDAALPAGAARVRLDADRAEIDAHPGIAADDAAGADALAYIIYTSGSTGRPKGVLVPHRGVLRLAIGADYVPLGADDRVAQLSTHAFDAATFEIWAPLLRGARIVVIPRDAALDPAELVRRLRERGVTTLFLTTALLNRLVEAVPDAFRTLRHLLFGGEAVDPARVRRALEAGAPERLLHVYGPTESTTFAAWEHVRAVPAGAETVPIGRGIAHTRLYVVDARMRPVPAGVPGELWVAGEGLAHGYRGRARLTAERFVPDPFAPIPGERAYRTGDWVRWTAEGSIEFLGRFDDQVKIRGYRVEPGEVRAALLALPGVKDAAVIVREDAPGERRLAAYAVPDASANGSAPTSGRALREALESRLPAYLVPSAVALIPVLPLNANGKVDRDALRPPEALEDAAEAIVPPRTATEEIVAGIWAGLLRRPAVGAFDDFFLLGGHSLLATQMVARACEVFGVKVPVRALFDHSTVEGFAEAVDALLGMDGQAAHEPLQPAPRDGAIPLSFAQRRLWFLDQLEPGSAAYNMAWAPRMLGALDAGALQRALTALAARHEALRTRFPADDGEPRQVVDPPAEVPLPVIDLSAYPADERIEEARRLAHEEALRPFDLAAGPVLRATLLRLAEGDHVALFTLHHIVFDGWSLRVMVRELSALYAAEAAGGDAALEPLPVQYADYAVWQRARLEGDGLDAQLGYWRERLDGAPPLLELPTDRPRAADVGDEAGRIHRDLSPELDAAMRGLARAEGATLFMVFLAGWQAVLGRWAGQDDVVVGAPLAGRSRVELEGLIGFFANTLALRARLDGDPTFSALVARVREAVLGAFAHPDVPFERVVEEVVESRSLAHAPLVQVAFSLERSDAGDEQLSLGGVAMDRFADAAAPAKFDLHLTVIDTGDSLRLAMHFREALFDAASAERMLEQVETLLAAAAADAGRPLSRTSLLSADERQRVLGDWNATAAPLPAAPVHALFAEQAALRPDAIAVVEGDRSLTYAELEARANRIARHLRSLGVGVESRVGVMLERGIDLVAAFLGILKAGGAYLPLDDAAPPERLREILADGEARVVIARSRDRLPDDVDLVALGDPAVEAALAALPPDALDITVDPDALAYVIYTSGSTGRPKGVAVPHRAVVRLVRETPYLPFGPEERFGLVSNPAFDAVTFDVWGALLNGGAVVSIARDVLLEPRALAAALREGAVTAMFLTAALFNRVAREIPDAFATMRHLLVGGEALDRGAIGAVLRGGPPTRLLNGYGPTEATTFAAWHEIGLADLDAVSIPIGRPLGNTALYVLDEGLAALPACVPGELCVGGPGVARGYLARPALTAERFVPDPFGAPGGRLYRTGDRVRWTARGVVEYLGRRDDQVKVRGFRIELREVEMALEAHPDVRGAAVVVRGEGDDRRLAAYAVLREGAEMRPAALREHLRSRLPGYMLPSAVVVLDAFPLNPNGKVDRAALPEPDWAGDADEHVPPRTEAEAALAALWAEVLARDGADASGFGVTDDFFLVGGHSLLVTQVIARVREAFGVEIPVRAFFEARTVEGLAKVIEDARAEAGEAPPDPITPAPRDRPIPLSFSQQRLWFLDRMEPGSAAYNLPFAVRLRGALDADALERALTALVARHEALRTRFPDADGEPRQAIDPPSPVPLPRVDLAPWPADEREAEARRLAHDEALRPFDLAAGPLLRATLLRLADDDHVVLFTLHHVVFDGWSVGVLSRELSALYAAEVSGRDAALPPLPVQYADYAVWQRERLEGDGLDAQLAYWRGRLADAPALLDLPTDRPRGPADARSAARRQAMLLPPDLARAVDTLAKREGATLFMAYLAAWQALLARWAGQGDVVVAAPLAGRPRVELEGLIGFFANTLALRTELGGDPTFAELLARARETALGALAHPDVPFERLVEELVPARTLAHAPLAQVAFSLDRSTPGTELVLDGLRMEAFGDDGEEAKFDLHLLVHAGAGGIHLTLQYRESLFDAGTAARMLDHLAALLRAAADEPALPLSRLPLLAGAERARVLGDWNPPAPPLPAATVHALFAEQAAQRPDAVAVLDGGRAVTYAELRSRAARIAHLLQSRGVEPGDRVGVMVERGMDLAASFLATLQAGAAYVAIDDSSPPDVIRVVLGDADARVILCRVGARMRLPGGVEAVELGTPEVEAELTASLTEDTEVTESVDPDGLAYLLYDDDGRNALAVTHRGAVRLARACIAIDADDRVAHVASPAVDEANAEVWGALLNGAALISIPRDAAHDARALTAAIREGGVTTMLIPGAVFGHVARTAPAAFASLRQLVIVGDAPAAGAVAAVLHAGPPARLLHAYAPRDRIALAAVHELRADDLTRATIPVGRPIGGAAIYVLNEAMEPQPACIPGDLYVGGEAAGRPWLEGNAGADELYRVADVEAGITGDEPHTERLDRFISDPFGAPGSLLYRTGDRARWTAEGALEILGHANDAIAIDGQPIQPRRVEAVLGAHADVCGAAVAARGEGDERRLVAYATPAEGAAVRPADLLAHLEARLPAALVPSTVVVLDALPLDARGRVDRAALPEPGQGAEEAEYVPPRTPIEEAVAAIWAEVLEWDVEAEGPVGVRDDFFFLGGHSLLVTQVIARVHQAFGVDVPVRDFFEAPTVEGLAAAVEAALLGDVSDDELAAVLEGEDEAA